MSTKWKWPILQKDGSAVWLSWAEMKPHIGTPGNSFDEVQERLTELMTRKPKQ